MSVNKKIISPVHELIEQPSYIPKGKIYIFVNSD